MAGTSFFRKREAGCVKKGAGAPFFLKKGARAPLLAIPAPWMDADEMGLVALTNAPIEMADPSYGRFLVMQKRDAERVFQHISPAEREAFLWKLMEIDAADAKDGQSPPLTQPLYS